MFENTNYKIIKTLAKRSIESNRLRNGFILITIIMSVAFITLMPLFISGMQEAKVSMLKNAKQVTYRNISEDQIESLKSDERIECLSITKRILSFERSGYMISGSYISDEKNSIKTINEEIVEGSIPKKINEVVVDKSYMMLMDKEAKLGEKINIVFLDGSSEDFIISGFTDYGDRNILNKEQDLLFSKAYAEDGKQLKDVEYDGYARIHGAENMSENEFLDIIFAIGEDYSVERRNVAKDYNFIYSISIPSGDVVAVIIIIGVVIFASILVIYSIFYISIMSRIKYFGQLLTIGMSKKQLKKMVVREGLMLGKIGIPIGALIGCVIAFFMNAEGFNIYNTIIIVLGVSTIEIITILISVAKPAKIASNISPIEAMSFAGKISIKESKKLNRKITPFNLAIISFNRNKKKIILTIMSLCVGGILFMSATTFIASVHKDEYSRQGDMRFGEYIIDFDYNTIMNLVHGLSDIQIDNPINDDLIAKIEAIPNITKVIKQDKTPVIIEYKETRSSMNMSMFKREDVNILSKYLTLGNINYDEMVKNNSILIMGNEMNMELEGWEYSLGDSVKLEYFNGEETYTNAIISGFIDLNYQKEKNVGWILIPEDRMLNMIGEMNITASLAISGDYKVHGGQIEEDLNDLIMEMSAVDLSTLREEQIKDADMLDTTFTVYLGLVCFIIAFSIINLINTLITSTITKKRELAMLASIGMGDKQIKSMIRWEGMALALINIIITLTIGNAIGYILVAMIKATGIEYLHYTFPIWYFTIYVFIIVLVPLVISQATIKVLNRQSLIERLRKTE